MLQINFINAIYAIRTWAHGFRTHFDSQVERIIKRLRRIEQIMANTNQTLQEVLDGQVALKAQLDKVSVEIADANADNADPALLAQVVANQKEIAEKVQGLDNQNPDKPTQDAPGGEDSTDAGEGDDTTDSGEGDDETEAVES